MYYKKRTSVFFYCYNGCGHIYNVTKVKLKLVSSYLTSYLTVVSAFGRHCGHTSLCNFFVCCFWFPPRFRLGFYFAYLYMLISHVQKKCHILIGCLFVNLRLTHEPCLGITTVSLYCFGSPRRKFSNYS